MVYNNLFNEKKMEDFISLYDDSLVISSPSDDPICKWIQKLNNNELEDEKKNYANFLMIILDKLLGYRVDDINFESDIGDEGRPVEFTFKKGDKEYVVVELKGTKTKDLNKRYNRGQSAIEQVTNYASIKEETQWAFVSNYNEFRLFNPNYREKYISFKFKSLTDPEVLKKFLLIFSKFSLIDKEIPQTLLKETRIIERKLEDGFYKLFSETRLMLIKELEHSSEEIDRVEAIRLAQLTLNRYIFICFAEDLKLIPSETTADVLLTPIEKGNIDEFTMWGRLNELFRFMYKGNEFRKIRAFNGGLFEENLKNLEIRDLIEDMDFFEDCRQHWKLEDKEFEDKSDKIYELLGDFKDRINPIYYNLLVISSFDFDSELDVNILGHIFENSIGDIEELKEEKGKDNTKQKQKDDGIFYTPAYITEYICMNTIIPYLSQSGMAYTVHELIREYETTNSLEDLDKKLKEIKIIDPACGSGAFLNKAVDVLFEIHEALHDSMYANDNSLDQYFDSLESRRQIISDNIFGVDINKESVEITKLSLFLKLATNGKNHQDFKLPNLDKNIKCGNSLIDDEKIAGDKAFVWKTEFKDILDSGGFDLILGNPPYGAKLTKEEKKFLNKNYIKGGSETAISFIKMSKDKLLKHKGKLGFIIPKTFTYASNYNPIQADILENIELVIDCGKVWKNVKLEQIIFILNKDLSIDDYFIGVREEEKFSIIDKIPKSSYDEFKLILNGVNNAEINLAKKIKQSAMDLGAICINKRGIIKNVFSDYGEFKYIGGKQIQRDGIQSIRGFSDDFNENAIIHENSVLVQGIVAHIQKPTDHIKITACIPQYNDYLIVDNINQITVNAPYSNYFVWALLNSDLINWYCYRFIYGKAIRTMRFDNPVTSRIPLPRLEGELVEIIINNAQMLNENYLKLRKNRSKFFSRLNSHFEGIQINKKLNNFEDIDFQKFLKILSKQGFKLSLKKEDEWEDYFNHHKNKCLEIIDETKALENEINKLIYDLYDLTADEIEIIENSFSE